MSAPARGSRFHERTAVSALYDDPREVDHVVGRLVRYGVPRDLIDVVVSPEAAARFYPDRARPPGRDAMRYAGAGGLIGLIAGTLVSLALVVWPGFQPPGMAIIAQLLGPNFGTVLGAVVGALIGLFVHRRAERRHVRAREAPDSIVIVVTARSTEEESALLRLLAETGKDPRVEA
ncbi:MAG TPA: hypothetical protein VF212_01705 [Longimicrobiales bacterium]